MSKKLGLDDAYSVETPEDNKRLYKDWAETYDAEFAGPRGYVYPQRIAEIYAQVATSEDVPILDVGAGTGLVGEAVAKHTSGPIDGIDISDEMLAVSRTKDVYRVLIQADLTQSLELDSETYGAVVSAGTFTHGHVGSAALQELLRVSKPGAVFVIGINGTAFDKCGFGSAFASLSADGRINNLNFHHVQYYEDADDEHGDDAGFTACFRKT